MGAGLAAFHGAEFASGAVAVCRMLPVGRGARRPVLGAAGGLQGATRWALLMGRDACVRDGIGRLTALAVCVMTALAVRVMSWRAMN